MHSLGETITMDVMTNFKNNKAFSLVEIVVAMIIASIVMLTVYVMLIVVYKQFNDLTVESERFNNLQVFERMFQRSAMVCSHYQINSTANSKRFCFYDSTSYKYEIYDFGKMNDNFFVNISTYSIKDKTAIYSGSIQNSNYSEYNLLYISGSVASASYNAGYYRRIAFPESEYKGDTGDEKKVLFSNIVKVYYETSSNIHSVIDLKKLIGKDLNELNDSYNRWEQNGYTKIYTPFIRILIIYKDGKNRLRKSYITCRLRNIEGAENLNLPN